MTPLTQTYDYPVLAEYMQWITVVDDICADLVRKHRSYLRCGLRCSDCCRDARSVLPIEAHFIRELLNILPKKRLWLLSENCEESTMCPFLIDDLCEIYTARPLLCRVNGLPLLFHSKDGPSIHCCELNFTTRKENDPFGDEDVLRMHALDAQLLEFNQRVIREFPQNHLPNERILMYDLIRQTLHEKGIL